MFKRLSLLMVAVVFCTILPAHSALAADMGYLSTLPFDDIVVGDVTYGDCVGVPTIVVYDYTRYGEIVPLSVMDQAITSNGLQGLVNLLFCGINESAASVHGYFQDKGYQNVSAYAGDTTKSLLMSMGGGTGSFSATMPYIVYVSEDGSIVATTSGKQTVSNLREKMQQLVDLPIDISKMPILAALPGNLSYNASNTSEQAMEFYRDYGVDTINSEVKTLAETITEGLENDYEKSVAIHVWIANNIHYDFDDFNGATANNQYDSYTTLITRKSVCEGFANLSIDMHRSISLPSMRMRILLSCAKGSICTSLARLE